MLKTICALLPTSIYQSTNIIYSAFKEPGLVRILAPEEITQGCENGEPELVDIHSICEGRLETLDSTSNRLKDGNKAFKFLLELSNFQRI